MSVSQGSTIQFDLDLQNFIEAERQVSRFNFLVHSLNEKCWDLCVHNVKAHLEPKTEGCIVNCVERFLDVTAFILNRLEKTQARLMVKDSMNFD